MKTKLLIILLSIILTDASAQNFAGQILDSKTKLPISYVNIGIVHQGVGTISDEEGNFLLAIDDKYLNDSVKIAILGYKFICLKVKDIREKYANITSKFYLEENSFSLKEVVIRPIKFRTETVGNTNMGSPCVTFIGDTAKHLEGCEIGTRIKIKKRPTFIDAIHFGICANEFDSLKIRLNIYSKDNQNVLTKPIYVTLKKGQKKITIDTKPYNIKVEDDFIIAFEAIQIIQPKKGNGKYAAKKFSFSGGFTGSDMITRMNIYDKWEKVKVVTIGFNADISYQYIDEGNWFQLLFK